MPVTTEGLFEAKAFTSFEPNAGAYVVIFTKPVEHIPAEGEVSERYRFSIEYLGGPAQEDGEDVTGKHQSVTLWVSSPENAERREKDLSTVKGAFDAAGVGVGKKKGGGSTFDPDEFVGKKAAMTVRDWENPTSGKIKKFYSFRALGATKKAR